MRGEPGNRECGNGIVLREVLLWGFVLGPPKAVDFDFDFDFGKRTIVIVAGRVWESGKPAVGFPLFPRTRHFHSCLAAWVLLATELFTSPPAISPVVPAWLSASV